MNTGPTDKPVEPHDWLQTLFDESPLAIGFSRDGVMLDANRAYLSLFGHESVTEIHGTSVLEQIALSHREQVLETITERARGHRLPERYQTRGLRKDGTEFPFEITTTRVVVADGPLNIAFISDVSEREHALDALRASADRHVMRHASRRLACIIAVSSVAAGCAGPSHTPAALAPLAPPGERAAVLYGIDGTHASPALLPLPLVRGSVAGKRTLMVVDTGTGANVIAAWFARSLGLQTSKVSELTHDPSGRPVAMERCAEPHLVIDGFDAVADRPTPVIDLPSSFEAAGIGVILSPQALAGADTTVILDMPRAELRRVRSRGPALDVAHEGTFELEHTSSCSQQGAGFVGTRLTATAIVDGVSTILEVDTGAFGSPIFLAAETEPGRKVLARPGSIGETGLSAAGTQEVVTAKDIPVRLGSQDRLANVTVMPGTRDPHCGAEGRLGLEWLRACVFTIGQREYRLRCENRPPR